MSMFRWLLHPSKKSQRGIWDAIGAIGGSLLGNKGAQQAAKQSETGAQDMFAEAAKYNSQQEAALRKAIGGIGPNPFFSGAVPAPQFNGANSPFATFAGGGAPTFTGAPAPPTGGGQTTLPANSGQTIAQPGANAGLNASLPTTQSQLARYIASLGKAA